MDNLREKHVPISEARRSFGNIEKELPYVDRIILTKKGRPLAILTAAPEIKKILRQKTAGSLRGTDFDNDKLWREVEKKKSRRRSVVL